MRELFLIACAMAALALGGTTGEAEVAQLIAPPALPDFLVVSSH
ncbi:MAG: hypothetical protein AAGA70_03590 [Pseudomonadota bacterium]